VAFSERTIKKLREASEQAGGKIYEDHEDSAEEDVTHFEEDDDPLTLVGDFNEEDEDAPVGEVPEETREDA
jgi:hypothetical protein